MKGWAVSKGEYSDYEVLAVFTDIEKAKVYCALNHSDWYPPFIEEMEIDPPVDGNIEDLVYARDAYVSERGRISVDYPIYVEKGTGDHVKKLKREGGYQVESKHFLTQERTKKILSDYLAKEKAEREGL